MAQKPSIPKGTRDFSPSEIAKRNHIFDTIKKQFELFGFQPIETPSFENSETLLGKYGDEGDRLIFKILNSGDFIKDSTRIIKDKTYLESIINLNFFKNFYKVFIEKNELLSKKGDSILYKLTDNDKTLVKSYLKSHIRATKPRIDSKQIENVKKIFLKKLLEDYNDILLAYTYDIVSNFKTSGANEKYWESHFNRLILALLNKHYSKYLGTQVSEKALRYDLTVPFARYVVMHQNEIDFPFKRYQIQPVWRADRPQKGRFREFYQCDADVVGANSLLQEVELIQLYDAVFTDLGLKGTTIKINNRKILAGIAEVIGAQDLLIDFTVALDKLDKIGEEKVKEEMRSKGISETAINTATPLFAMTGDPKDQLGQLRSLLEDSEVGMQGAAELEEILVKVSSLGLKSASLQLDVTLARGLNYYTGAIFEVAAPKGVKMGAIGGGGRYDDLTGIFGLKEVSGVGISFGLDRIYLVLEELELFPEAIDQSLQVLCLNFGEKESMAALKLVSHLRQQGVKADLYPSDSKVQKQFKYADKRGVPYVILLGAKELEENQFVVKHMSSGEQVTYQLDEPSKFITSL